MSDGQTIREAVLMEAASLINGDRNQSYGSPTQNFTNTAEIWTTLLRHKLKAGERILPDEVATMMIGLKLARTVAEPKRDNFVDMAGYAGCGYEAAVESGRIGTEPATVPPESEDWEYYAGSVSGGVYRARGDVVEAFDPSCRRLTLWTRQEGCTAEYLAANPAAFTWLPGEPDEVRVA